MDCGAETLPRNEERSAASSYLPDAFADDPDRLARFQREAQVLASLNHPNIAAIYGLEESAGTRALVLELVEGPTLADRIKRGPIPLDEALPIAKQIAEALEAAHEAGVIHRDLKPANIKVRDDGTVKVLDFGLAKALDPSPEGDPSQSPTLTAAATQMGVIMGTAAYMSPEQAAGESVDKRSDIWSFGVVLFEMLTGQRLFEGKTVAHVMARVLDRDLDLSVVPRTVPAPIRRLLRRCLEREQRRRLRDVGEALSDLEEAATAPAEDSSVAVGVAASQLLGWRSALPWTLGALVIGGVATGFAMWGLTRSTPSVPRVEQFEIAPPAPEALFVPGISPALAISPDGSRVVYTTGGTDETRLYVRAVGDLAATRIQGLSDQPFGPFISPDGASVGFEDERDRTLKRVSILGGPAVTISKTGTNVVVGASWGEDGTIIFATSDDSGLWRVPDSGGEPEEISVPGTGQDQVNHAWPHILPGGRAVLFTIVPATGIENTQVAVLDLDTSEHRVLVPGGGYARYSSTGHLVYGINGTLRAVRFDLDRLEVTDPNPVPVLDGVVTKPGGAAEFDLARDGSLVYLAGDSSTVTGLDRALVWVDRQGDEVPLDLPARAYMAPRVSPDGTRLVTWVLDPENSDIWISDVERGTLAKLTTALGLDTYGLWTPDETRIVFQSQRDGARGLFWAAADGSGEVERLITIDDARTLRPYAWSSDGRTLVFDYSMADTGENVGVLSMEGERAWEPLLATEANEQAPAISPDGQWIAYTSDETGDRLVYVERFPQGGSRQTISRVASAHPTWSPDGRELFYIIAGGGRTRMMVVPVETGSTLRIGEATMLFESQYFIQSFVRSYDISPDGHRFLMIKPSGSVTTDAQVGPRAILVKNWTEELKRLAPVP